jgi:hypothetical protein
MSVGKLNLLARMLRKLLGHQCRPELIELNLLGIGHGRHQAQVVPEGMLLSQRAQTPRPPSEQARRVGQSHAWDGPFGKSLNLAGI